MASIPRIPAAGRPAAGVGFAGGLLLALVPTVLWGALPVALAGVITRVDVVTVTWCRFCVALGVQSVYLATRPELGAPWRQSRQTVLLMSCVALGFVGNFVLFASSLRFISASTAATVSQLQPALLLVGSLTVLRTRLSPAQVGGVVLLLGGLLLFLSDRLAVLVQPGSRDAIGLLLCLTAAVLWSGAGIVQKLIDERVATAHVLWFFYMLGSVCLAPLVSPRQLLELNPAQAWLLAFSCFNTLAAYGAFSLAVRRWDVVRVSAVISLGALFTYAIESVAAAAWPGLVTPEQWTAMTLAGGVLVAAGSLLTTIAGRR